MNTIAELRAFVSAQHETLLALDRQLDPFWAEEHELRDLLIQTHHSVDGVTAQTLGIREAKDHVKYVIAFGFENRALRSELFVELDRLRATWAPIRSRRHEIKADIAAAKRAIDHIIQATRGKIERRQLQLL